MIGTDADAELTARFQRAGGAGKPRYAELTVCWGPGERAARRLAKEVWPTAAMESSLSWELPLPSHFEAVAQLVTEERIAESVVCGPDPARHLAGIAKYVEAGYDHVCVHQVGPDQAGFMRFYEREILPRRHAGQRRVTARMPRPALPGKAYRPPARGSAGRASARDVARAQGRAQKLLLGPGGRRTWTWRADA